MRPIVRRSVFLLVAAIVGASALSGCRESTRPEPCTTSCPTGRVAFVRDGQIFVVNADGSNLVQLTQSGSNWHPAWSPDGERIAFMTREGGGASDVAVMDANGTNVRVVATQASWPSWSPDGRTLAISKMANGHASIMVVPVDGPPTSPTSLELDVGYQADPAWSPSGGKIAFVADYRMFDMASDVYVVNADGSGAIVPVSGIPGSGASSQVFQPAWSPNGDRLAIVDCREHSLTTCGNSTVAILNADGSGFRVLVETNGMSRPGWSRDGRMLVFSAGCVSSSCQPAVHLIDADGRNERVLIANAQNAAWYP